MRSLSRLAALAAVASMAISCTGAPTASDSALAKGRIELAPSFSPAATLAYNALSAFGLDVTSVHVHLVAPDGSARDTSIAFPLSLQALEVDLDVPLRTAGQTFRADLQLLNSDGQVLFSGSQQVVARASNQPGDAPVVVTIQYTGPGAGAKTVTVTPASQTIVGTLSVPVAVVATDATGGKLSDVIVRFTTSDASLATVTQTGNSTATVTSAGKRGTVTISAITPLGVTGTATVTLVPIASRIVIISGGAQTTAAGSIAALPIVVEVQAADGLPVPGVAVTFRAVSAGGVVTTTSATSDAGGRASTTFTLGQTAGTYQFQISSGSLTPVTVTETATAAPASTLTIVGGDFQSGTALTTLPQRLVVKVVDRFGAPVGGATVQWNTVSGLGSPSASSTTTAADGTASVSYTLGSRVQTESVRAFLPNVPGPSGEVFFSLGAVASPPDAISGTGSGQHAPVGTALPTPLIVHVIDALGNPVSGQAVTWSVIAGSTATATLSPTVSTTDVAGNASTIVTLGGTPGPLAIRASVAGLSFTFAETADPGSSTGPGTLSGFVFDAVRSGPIAGASVTVVQGNQTVASVTTSSGGTYSTPQLPAGTYSVTISASGYTTVGITTLDINGNTQAPAIPMVPASTQLGSIAGTVFDATNNQPLTTQVSLELRAGVNNTTGSPLQTVTTSSNAAYVFSNVSAGTYTVVARASGFADASKTGIAVGGSATSGQDIFMSPAGRAGNVRIVLTWRASPTDLDSYITGPLAQGGRFFVYYDNPGDCANPPYACLDNDVTNGFGPETITITQVLTGTYRYTVNNYSGESPLDQSGARVDVYINNSLAQSFSVPAGSGDNWTVFELNGTTITPINTIGSGQITSRIPNDGGVLSSRNPASSTGLSSSRGDNALIATAIRRHPKRQGSRR